MCTAAEEQMLPCVECRRPAVIVDGVVDWPWCLRCAVAILRGGDPILEYRELSGGSAYTWELQRSGAEASPFGQRRAS